MKDIKKGVQKSQKYQKLLQEEMYEEEENDNFFQDDEDEQVIEGREKHKNIFGLEKIGIFGTILILFSKLCVVGIVVIPFIMKDSGIIMISIMIGVTGALLSYTNYILFDVLYTKKINSPDIHTIIKETSNKYLAYFSSAIFFIVQIGICTIYLLLIAEYIRHALCSMIRDEQEEEIEEQEIEQTQNQNQSETYMLLQYVQNLSKNINHIIPQLKTYFIIFIKNMSQFQIAFRNISKHYFSFLQQEDQGNETVSPEVVDEENDEGNLSDTDNSMCDSRVISIILACIPIICLSFIRQVKYNQIFHNISTILVSSSLLVFFVYLIFQNESDYHLDYVYKAEFTQFAINFGIIVFALTAHTYVFQLRYSMKQPKQMNFLNGSITLVLVIFYIFFGYQCLSYFGQDTGEIGIFGVDFSEGWLTIIPFLFTLGVLLNYPAQLLPLLKQFEQTFFEDDEDTLLLYEKTEVEKKQEEHNKMLKRKAQILQKQALNLRKKQRGKKYENIDEEEELENFDQQEQDDFFMKNLLVRGLLIILILFMGFFFADFSCLISIVGNVGGYYFGFLIPLYISTMETKSRPQIVINLIILFIVSIICVIGFFQALFETIEAWQSDSIYKHDRFI